MLGVVLLAGLVLCSGPLVVSGPRLANGAGVELLLDTAGIAFAGLLGVMCIIRWRLVGQSHVLWLAAAALTYGVVTVGTGHVLPQVLGATTPPDVLIWLHPASRIAAIGMLLAALAWPEVDASMRPSRVFGLALGFVAVTTLLFQLAPGLAANLAGADDALAMGIAFPTGSVVLVVALLGVAWGFLWRAQSRPRPLFPSFAVMFVALALAEVHRVLPFTDDGAWAVGDSALRLIGLLVGVAGVVGTMAADFGLQSGRLLESVASSKTAEARTRAEHAAAEERAHEARNALAAIEGATRTLEHYRDRLDAETRASLAEAVTAEIARLQRLVSAEAITSQTEEFTIDRALRSVLTTARTHALELEVDIEPDATAFGRGAETAEVVQNLIENARRYAPGSPIVVRTERDEVGITVRVEDRGPGIAPDERRSIFARGYRGRRSQLADGSGLGLYVSKQLMLDQGGDLWVEPRPGGGASFALWLPSAPGAAAHEIDDVGQVVEEDVGGTGLVGEHPHPRGIVAIGEADDDVSHDGRG